MVISLDFETVPQIRSQKLENIEVYRNRGKCPRNHWAYIYVYIYLSVSVCLSDLSSVYLSLHFGWKLGISILCICIYMYMSFALKWDTADIRLCENDVFL